MLSTHFEGLPLSLIEGLAAGCACIIALGPAGVVCGRR
jgi:hypothetical protein